MRTPCLLAILLLATSCAARLATAPRREAIASSETLARYFPLAIGNRWTWQVRTGNRVERATVRIVDRKRGFFVDDAGGALAFDGEGLRDERRYLVLGPLEPGRTWQSLLEDGTTERYRIAAVGARVAVPAGTFDEVVVVRGTTPVDPRTELEIEWAWAPDVGLIRMASELVAADGERIPQRTMELLSFERAE